MSIHKIGGVYYLISNGTALFGSTKLSSLLIKAAALRSLK